MLIYMSRTVITLAPITAAEIRQMKKATRRTATLAGPRTRAIVIPSGKAYKRAKLKHALRRETAD